MFFYHKKFRADFLRSPRARLSDCSLRLLPPPIRFEAKEIMPPARPRLSAAAGSVDAAAAAVAEVDPEAEDDDDRVDEDVAAAVAEAGVWFGTFAVSAALLPRRLRSRRSVSSLLRWASRLRLANLSSDLVSTLGDM